MKKALSLSLSALMCALSLCACGGKTPVPPQPAAESAVSTAASVTEPITEPVTAPVTEPATEPVTEPVTEPATEPVTEPATEPATEPVTEPVTEPLTEAVVEPAPEPTYEEETTKTGHLLKKIDGVAYVDGQVIANKTYSLPQSYVPALTSEDLGDAFPVTPETRVAFLALRAAAQTEGLWLFSVSSFRSYDLQNWLYWSYVNRDGQAAADRFSARPGHSEHQTGLAIDINSCEDSFEYTPEAAWLAAHCTEYGFILRYPKGKEEITGYMYEPWHIRYVGSRELAEAITAAGTMEEYYGLTSVYPD